MIKDLKKEVKLQDCCDSISDGDHLPPPKSKEGIPFITISDITQDNEIDFSSAMHVPESYYSNLPKNKIAQKGDILYSVVGSFGKPVFIEKDEKFVFQRHIAILKPNKSVNGRYLYYSMLNPIFYKKIDKQAIGCSQRTVTLETLRHCCLELPSIDSQNIITNFLALIDRKIRLNKKVNDNFAA